MCHKSKIVCLSFSEWICEKVLIFHWHYVRCGGCQHCSLLVLTQIKMPFELKVSFRYRWCGISSITRCRLSLAAREWCGLSIFREPLICCSMITSHYLSQEKKEKEGSRAFQFLIWGLFCPIYLLEQVFWGWNHDNFVVSNRKDVRHILYMIQGTHIVRQYEHIIWRLKSVVNCAGNLIL